MISGRQDVSTCSEQIIANARCYTKTAGGVLTIDDSKINGKFIAQVTQLGNDPVTGGAPDNVPLKTKPASLFPSSLHRIVAINWPYQPFRR